MLQNINIEINEDRYLLGALTKACKLQNDTITTRLPIRKPLLNQLLQFADTYFLHKGQPYLAALYKAMFASAYFGLLHTSEIAVNVHAVKVTDIHIANNKFKFLFMLRSSKTHCKSSKPQLIRISTKTAGSEQPQAQQLCPYHIL